MITFVGFGIHRGLPADTTAGAVAEYARSVGAAQAGLGNYLELLGYVLFLCFAAYVHAVARAQSRVLQALNNLGFAAAIAYTAVSALGVAAQQVVVEWGRAGADGKALLGLYLLDSEAFTMSFQVAAVFALATGSVLFVRGFGRRIVGATSVVVGAVLFLSGLTGSIVLESSVPQTGFLLFEAWIVGASTYFAVRSPAVIDG